MKSRHAALRACLAVLGVAALVGLTSLAIEAAAGSSATIGAKLVAAPRVAVGHSRPAVAAARPRGVQCARYAAPSGRDGNRGTKTRPFRSAQRLARSLRSGQTGCLRAGTYDQTFEGYVLNLSRGGARGAPITIRSYPRERAKLVGIVQIGNGANWVRLSGLAFEGTGAQNTIKIYAADVVVQNSDITNLGRGNSCMILGSSSGRGEAVRTVVRGNRFHDCGSLENENKDHAIYVSHAVNVRILRNVFWNSAAYAVHLYPNARGSRIAYNMIDGGEPSMRGGVLFGGNDDYASRENVVERNVIAYAQTHNITSTFDEPVGSGNLARSNCLWGGKDSNIDDSNGGFDAQDNVVAPPRFVSRRKRDYRLQPRSPCRRVIG